MKQLFKKALFVLISFGMFTTVVNGSAVPTSGDPVQILLTDPVNPTSIHEALAGFKDLSKKERRSKIKDVKSAIKEYKLQKKAGAAGNTNQLLLIILAILLPPLAVYIHQGEINKKFWISLLLTLLFFAVCKTMPTALSCDGCYYWV